jgi:hypothetical protein
MPETGEMRNGLLINFKQNRLFSGAHQGQHRLYRQQSYDPRDTQGLGISDIIEKPLFDNGPLKA